MLDHDFDTFAELLDATCSMLSRGTYVPNATNTALFFAALRAHSVEAVRAGFNAHIRDGKFPPVPADILGHLTTMASNDRRPGPEEAWASALLGRDEANTIVWSDEMSTAWGIAGPVLRAGDEVGARMAFKEAYTRLVAEARAAGRAPRWSASLGFDTEQRARVLETAVTAGLLPAPEVAGLLPPPEARAGGIAPKVREALLALRERLVSQAEQESVDAAEKRETAAAKAAVARRVAGYCGAQQRELAMEQERAQ